MREKAEFYSSKYAHTLVLGQIIALQ